MALALEQYEASLCPGCHELAAETTNIRHDANYDGEDAAPYGELSRVICHRCLARQVAAEGHEESKYEGAALYTIGVKPPEQAGGVGPCSGADLTSPAHELNRDSDED
jgi:hypothetical protein